MNKSGLSSIMARIRRVDSEREQEKLLDEFLTKGYRIQEQGQYSARVKEKDWGSVPVHGFVFFFTFIAAAVLFDAANVTASAVWVVAFLANVIYAVYSWFTSEEVVIKVNRD